MTLPFAPPLTPMLAKATPAVPVGAYLYEPKWDGFRCLVFRDGDVVELLSRSEKPLTRYFPEMVAALQAALPQQCVLDGELFIATTGGLDFDLLSQRIHPAESRINRLAAETPAMFVAFDLLARGSDDLRDRPLGERHVALRALLADAAPPVLLTPATTDVDVARDWFTRFEGAGFDGIVAKPVADPYQPGVRGWLKVKHARDADCVVAGYRVHKDGAGVGSLMLGLYNDAGELQHVGVASSFSAAKRRELMEEMAPYIATSLDGHPWAKWDDPVAQESQRLPGAVSRWTGKRTLDWVPVRPERVVEVQYEHMQGTRFRHTTRFKRWRDDREPQSCTYEQLEVPVPAELKDLFGL
jgi:ATP-dependent DNA ligase